MRNLSREIEQTPYVFVYGTLKQGYRNWSRLLSEEEFIGPDVTKDNFYMISFGCPMIFPEDMSEYFHEEAKALPIEGEVFRMSSISTLLNLDRLEAEGTLYDRVLTETQGGIKCWLYQSTRGEYADYSTSYYNINSKGNYQWN